jgi:hypothetical protein
MNVDQPIAVTLTAGEWNHIMQLLADQPYKLCAQHIMAIQAQCMSAEMNGVQGPQNVSTENYR